MKLRTFFKRTIFVFAPVVGTAALAVACSSTTNSGQSNPFFDKKEIVIAVDGAQTDFYNYVRQEFNKSDIARNGGYSIQFVQKDVFGALDISSTIGFNNENVSDLFYAPQDRVTGLLQQKAIAPWSEEFVNQFFKDVGATQEEIASARNYGDVQIDANRKAFYAMPHNQEGLSFMTSFANKTDALAYLQNQDTDSILEIARAGDGLFRFQDFFYGIGLFGGTLTSEQLGKILYQKDDQKWSSGFIKGDTNHAAFKKAIDFMSEIWYPVWKAAYTSQANYDSSPYSRKGITRAELQTFLGSDQGAVQNLMFKLIREKKLKVAMVGTFDVGVAVNNGINEFYNIQKLADDTESGGGTFLQPRQSWSYLINARNINISENRQKAFEEILKIIYSPRAYFEYFEDDSKVPFFKARQAEVEKTAEEVNSGRLPEVNRILTETGYENVQSLEEAYNKALKPVNDAFANPFDPNLGASYQFIKNDTPLSPENTPTPVISKNLLNSAIIPESAKEQIRNFQPKQVTGLRNLIATLLGLQTLPEVNGQTRDGTDVEYLVGPSRVKNGVTFDASLIKAGDSETSAHVRAIEKAIFDVDGDVAGEREAFIKKIQASKDSTLLDGIIKKATDFSNTYSKTPISAEDIRKVTNLYYNNFENIALFDNLKAPAVDSINKAFFKKADGTDSSVTNLQVKNLVDEQAQSQVFNRVLSIVTNDKEFSQGGIGVLKTQENRLDNFNPQFGPVFGEWNDQIFGNKQFLSEELAKNLSLEEFKREIENRLDTRFRNRASALDASGAKDFVDLTQR